MKTKLIKLIAIITIAACSIIAPATSTVFADGETSNCVNKCDPSCKIPEDIKKSYGCHGGATGDINDTVINVLESIIGVLGLVAVIFIVVGGINYMTSAGDATKVKKAKDTILYACIGLAICALAFAIVNFAIGIINGTEAP